MTLIGLLSRVTPTSPSTQDVEAVALVALAHHDGVARDVLPAADAHHFQRATSPKSWKNCISRSLLNFSESEAVSPDMRRLVKACESLAELEPGAVALGGVLLHRLHDDLVEDRRQVGSQRERRARHGVEDRVGERGLGGDLERQAPVSRRYITTPSE